MSIPTTPQKSRFGVNTNPNFNTYEYQTPGRPDPNPLKDGFSSPQMSSPSDDWFKEDNEVLSTRPSRIKDRGSPDK